MAEVLEASSDQNLPIDTTMELDNLKSCSASSEIQDKNQNKNLFEMEINQDKENLESSVDKPETNVDEKREVNVIEDIVQLVELVKSCVTKDGTCAKTKYKDGFLFLENLQTQFENIQDEITEKDKMIVALVIENSSLKGEANLSKEELNKKCQQLEKLEHDYAKFRNEIQNQKVCEKIVVPPMPLDILKSTAEKMHQNFNKLKSRIELQLQSSNSNLSSLQSNTSLKTYHYDVENSLKKVDHNLSLLAKRQAKIEKQLNFTEKSLNKLSDLCANQVQSTIVVPKSQLQAEFQQQNNSATFNLPSSTQNAPEKHNSSMYSLSQAKPTPFQGFNVNSMAIPSVPYLKPFSSGPQNPNDQSNNFTQQSINRTDQIPKPTISRNPSNLPLNQQQQQPVSLGNSEGRQNVPVIQEYPNPFSQAQNKCTICGMTFFNSVQLKLHGDLVHQNTTLGSAEMITLPALPYKTYTQIDLPNPTPIPPEQMHYQNHLWVSSKPTLRTNPKRISTNLSSSSSLNQNAHKRHCADLFVNFSYPPLSIPNNTFYNSARTNN